MLLLLMLLMAWPFRGLLTGEEAEKQPARSRRDQRFLSKNLLLVLSRYCE